MTIRTAPSGTPPPTPGPTWARTDQLQRGDNLRTPTSQPATVVHVHSFTRAADMYNLTIAGVHTYYVLAGSASILVHNSDECSEVAYNSTDLGRAAYKVRVKPGVGAGRNV